MKIPTLSFCITCMNRFYQIEKTLKQNLDDNRMFKHLIEFILVDFSFDDELECWIKSTFRNYLKCGYLKYFRTNELKQWHASIAKNTSHFHASNDILVNLDCDNYTGRNGGKFIIQQFLKHKNDIVLHQFGGDPADGSFGRIGVKRRFFELIGGYDESFEPMGYQDGDLIERLQQIGLQYVLKSNEPYNQAIRNTKTESILHVGSSRNWNEMDQINRQTSKKNIQNGILRANCSTPGIPKNLSGIMNKTATYHE